MRTTRRRVVTGVAMLVLAALAFWAAACSRTVNNGTAGNPTTPPTTATTRQGTGPSAPSSPDDDATATPAKPGDRTISSRVSYGWAWPGPGAAAKVTHTYKVPPLPYLYSIGAAPHSTASPPYDQISFRFKGTFPTYELEYVPSLTAGGSGNPVHVPGGSILRVTFRSAQAHTENGASSIVARPSESLNYKALAGYKQAEDFEGVLTYGLGIGHPVNANPQTRVRVYEVEKIEDGQHLYVVAIQIDATQWR